MLGPPIALALKKPFIMIRKRGKLPNAVSGQVCGFFYNSELMYVCILITQCTSYVSINAHHMYI